MKNEERKGLEMTRREFLKLTAAGAILTPPDVISQLMLSVPLLLLYEVGVIVARVCRPSATLESINEFR